MFSGAYEHTVDDKGRTVIPLRFRQKLGEKFVITRGLHGCLWVFTEVAWAQVQQMLAPKSLLDERAVKLQRYFVGAAVECAPDKQGRVIIPQMLLNLAGIKCGDEIWIMGLTDKIEIWSKARWEEHNMGLTDEVIAELGKEAETSQ